MFSSGYIDPVQTAKILKENGCISSDVILIFDEIYIQKSEEYFGGETFGTDEDGAMYNGLVCFMIIGLTKTIPYVLYSLPKKNLKGDWLRDAILKCIKTLQDIGYHVRGVVCDNHSSNVSAYRKLLTEFAENTSDLSIMINNEPIYLFFDTVHLMKNIRNNLLARKRFLFPSFHSDALQNSISVDGGEISWKVLHQVHDKDAECQANLRAAPKLTAEVLHPGNCKQNVAKALAIFDPSTIAAIRLYFPESKEAADFLHLFHVWWTVSNSKQRFNSNNKLGNAAVPNDGKPQFLREMADWIDSWQDQKIPNCENFTLSAQTSAALTRTLRCHANLVEDLLRGTYQFILTARFQSDPIERRFGQYRQMSGGRFLVSAKEVSTSENILKIKTLVKEGFDLSQSFKVPKPTEEAEENLISVAEQVLGDVDSIQLNDTSKSVSDNIAGYIAHKKEKLYDGCCGTLLLCDERKSEYIEKLSRGGLKKPSLALSDTVSKAFALLDTCSEVIRRSDIDSKSAGMLILHNFLDSPQILCQDHQEKFTHQLMIIVCNCFFSAQKRSSNEVVVKDRVAEFKRNKRQKL